MLGETVISAGPTILADPFNWSAVIAGPPGSPYEGGRFAMQLQFPIDYPFKPPYLRFVTQIWHPNVSVEGGVCMDVLQDKWTPAFTVAKLLLSVASLLSDPNPDHPLRVDIALEMIHKKDKFEANAREYTQRFAMNY